MLTNSRVLYNFQSSKLVQTCIVAKYKLRKISSVKRINTISPDYTSLDIEFTSLSEYEIFAKLLAFFKISTLSSSRNTAEEINVSNHRATVLE